MAEQGHGLSQAEELQLKKRYLFTPLETKEALHDWIEVFLGLDMPGSIVDERSNSSPMDLIFEIYDKCRRNDDPDFNTILGYASRMSFKTLSASVLEVLMLFHLGRSGSHMAAIEGQAKKSQEYVKKFLRRPLLRDFVVGNNQRRVEVTRYEHPQTKEVLTPREWGLLPQPEQDQYKTISNYIAIVICTMQGANSEHTNFMCVDEIDVVSNPAAYAESKAIPDTFEGKMPVTFLTSTRKFSYGLVQKEIDEAEDTGLIIRHFNIIDVTEKCPTTRHRPDLPRIPIYRSDDLLSAVSEKDYNEIDKEKQDLYIKDEGFDGCLSNCKIFTQCRTRLVTHQLSTSNLLKKIAQTQNQFRKFEPEMAKSQLLCWKPSTEGLIYPRLDRTVHVLSAAQIANKITGEDYNPKMTKSELIALLNSREVTWWAGMDWGVVHDFAVVLGAKDGHNMYIIDVISQSGLELGQKLELCDRRIKPFNPIIFADTASPGDIRTFKKNQFRMRDWSKLKGSVASGIEVVRFKMWPTMGQPQLFFLAEDEGVGFLLDKMSQYHWKTDATGRVTETPDDVEDDALDALRYLIMNCFAAKGKMSIAKNEEVRDPNQPRPFPTNPTEQNTQQHHFQQLLNYAGLEPDDEPDADKPKRKGGFKWLI